MKKIIYDFGSNNGDDIPYYLLKSDLVIAVEANPTLCEVIKNRFHKEILKGTLVVENCVLVDFKSGENVHFYIHKRDHVLSQFPEPDGNSIDDFEKVLLPAFGVTQLIQKHGMPYYIKIDIEHFDAQILRALLKSNILPPYISAESHTIEVFSILVTMGYNSFKLLEGKSIDTLYKNSYIEQKNKKIRYSFPYDSAGPFGNDITGGWMTADNFFLLLAQKGLGWIDIHATLLEKGDPTLVINNIVRPKNKHRKGLLAMIKLLLQKIKNAGIKI